MSLGSVTAPATLGADRAVQVEVLDDGTFTVRTELLVYSEFEADANTRPEFWGWVSGVRGGWWGWFRRGCIQPVFGEGGEEGLFVSGVYPDDVSVWFGEGSVGLVFVG